VPLGDGLGGRIADLAASGRRVVLVARSPAGIDGEALPPGLAPLGIVVLAEAMRPEAAGTVAFLTREGVRTRVISGDAPGTVRAVAVAAGVPGAEGPPASGADLPDDPEGLADVAEATAVFGRITPEQKRSLVRAMTARGRFVAMTGDGVNDVLALKEARLGIAMGQGSQIAKGVAGLVLLSNSFATVPRAVAEGRRIIRNTHRVAKLFVAKSVYSALVLATLGLAPIAYPFLARQITIASTLTIGVPAFFLALAPSEGPVRREGFMRSLLAFVVPAGVVTAATIVAGYLVVRGALDASVVQGRTAAVLITTGMGLAIVVEVERGLERRRVRPWVWAMVALFAVALVGGLQVPFLRDFFAMEEPAADVWLAVGLSLLAGIAALVAVRRIPWLARREGAEPPLARSPATDPAR
jgi:cation-transporting ATPase E